MISVGRIAKRFSRDRRGAAAVEAAILFPLLAMIFLGLVELTLALDSRRAVQNASYSLVQAAAARSVVDADSRARLQRGYELSVEAGGVNNVRANLQSWVRQRDGSFSRDWSWNPTQGSVGVANSRISGSFSNTTQNREGILVAIVEGEYQPVLKFALPDGITFDGVFSQVPMKKTVAIYRP